MPDDPNNRGSSSGFLASERFDYVQYFLDNEAALDRVNNGDGAGVESEIELSIFLDDLGQGSSQAGGAGGGIAGLAVGALYGLIDGLMFDAAIDASIDEAAETANEINEEIESIMDFRANIENKLAQFTTPQEQALRERARAFGLSQRAQGLSGAQAIAAQQIAETMYREQVGGQLPQAISVASAEARADAIARLQALEAKFGITLNVERQQLLEQQVASQFAGGTRNNITTGIGAIGQGLGSVFDLIADQNGQNQGGPTGSAIPGFTDTPGADTSQTTIEQFSDSVLQIDEVSEL